MATALLGCLSGADSPAPGVPADSPSPGLPPPLTSAAGTAPSPSDERWGELRARMVASQIAARGIREPAVLRALRTVPRHLLVPPAVRDLAYEDGPLPIGFNQTISQPYIVALMTDLARVRPGDKVLEIGTGSGYQAAVLAETGATVYTIEIVAPLAERARQDLEALGYGGRVTVRAGDGYRGWPEQAPFAAVLVTAAPPEIPPPLLDQLAPGGRLVAPVGVGAQELVVAHKAPDGAITRQAVIPVLFVPMTGEATRPRP